MMTFTHEEIQTLLQMVIEDIRSCGFSYVPVPTLDTSLRGRKSGQAFFLQNKIRINRTSRSEDDIINTLKHEMAHLLAWVYYNERGHGSCWKGIMIRLGGSTNRCHNMNLPYARKMSKIKYACSCMEHEVTTIISNRLEKGLSIYKCKKCKTPLHKVEDSE